MRGRIRTVKPEALTDEALWDLEVETGLPIFRAFVGLWTQADREGRFEWRPRPLKAAILPYWDGDFSRVLDALTTRGFVQRYASGGREYGFVRTFLKHQAINNREEQSRLPPPPQSVAITDTLTRDARVTDATPTPLSSAQGERKGREGNGSVEERARDHDPPEVEPDDDDRHEPWAGLDWREVSRAWSAASAQFVENDPRAKPAFEAIAKSIQLLAGDESRIACWAYCHWVWQAPDGPHRSGRIRQMRPWSVSPGVAQDLRPARDWFDSLDGESRRAVLPPGFRFVEATA